MSQNSTTSTTSFFSPINVDNGDGESNSQPTTRLDKQVASVQRLQSDADVLKQSASILDEVLTSLDRFNGISKDIAKLKLVKETLLNVSNTIQRSAVSLSPIPSIGYVHSRKKTQLRSVSPDTTPLDSINEFIRHGNFGNVPSKR